MTGTLLAVGARLPSELESLRRARGWTLEALDAWGALRAAVERAPEGVVCVVGWMDGASTDAVLEATEAAAARAPGVRLGFVLGTSPPSLAARLHRMAAPPPAAPADGPQWFLDGLGAPILGARLAVLDPTAGRDALDAAVGGGASLLVLAGHANGLHFHVGAGALCRRESAGPDADLRSFACFRGEPCRYGAKETDVSRLNARIVIAATCWGVYLPDAVFAPHLVLGRALAELPSADAVLTSVRVASFSMSDLSLLYYMVNSGQTVGEVVARVNRFRAATGGACDLVCFGDPEARLAPTLERAFALPVADGGYLVSGPKSGRTWTDIAVRLPPGARPSDPVLEVFEGAIANACVDDEGTVYATVPSERATALRLRLRPREELVGFRGYPKRLLADVHALDGFVAALASPVGAGVTAKAIVESASALRDFLHDWPLLRIPVGAAVTGADVLALRRALDARVETVGDAIVRTYGEMIRTHGTLHTVGARPVTAGRIEARRTPERCAYCGQAIDETTYPSAWVSAVRRVGVCRGCGPIYDVPGAAPRPLLFPARMRAGEKSQVRVVAASPYAVGVRARAVAALEGYERETSFVSPVYPIPLSPHESQPIELPIDVPAGCKDGTAYLGVAVAVGPHASYFRAPVVIEPASAARRLPTVPSGH